MQRGVGEECGEFIIEGFEFGKKGFVLGSELADEGLFCGGGFEGGGFGRMGRGGFRGGSRVERFGERLRGMCWVLVRGWFRRSLSFEKKVRFLNLLVGGR